MSDGVDPDFRDDASAGRFELPVGAYVAFSEYRPIDDGISFFHTVVPEALAGQGVGGRLVRSALLTARARGWKVRPDCSFVAGYLQKHPEFADLVAP